MSNVGQIALTIVGTVVGAYFGNPELGFALGSLAGSVLFPTQLPSGPKLTDNRTTTASLGEPTPIVFGTASVAGTVIWLAPSVETPINSSSKGGPNQTTYQYNQSIAIGLCEASVDGVQAIEGLTRVWENGTLVFDIRPQQPFISATDTPAETDEAYAARLSASATYADMFTLYLGSEDQLADPTIEAVEGFGQVQPFRGLAYIVYPNRLLQTTQGWRHPNFQFEVYTSGTGNCTETETSSTDQIFEWADGGGTENPSNPNNLHRYSIASVDPSVTHPSGGPWDNLGDALAAVETAYGFSMDQFVTYAVTDVNVTGGVSFNNAAAMDVAVNPPVNSPATNANGYYRASDFPFHLSLIQAKFSFRQPDSGEFFYWGSALGCPGDGLETSPPARYFYRDGSVDGIAWTWGSGVTIAPTDPTSGKFLGSHFENCGGLNSPGMRYYATQSADIVIQRLPSPPLPICANLPDAPNPLYCVLPNGQWQKKEDWVLVDPAPSGHLQLQNYGTAGSNKDYVPIGPVMPTSDPRNTEAFWTTAYEAARDAGMMDTGLTYGTQYPVICARFWTITKTICQGQGAQVSIAEIIAAVCKRSGIDNYDVTDMEDQLVDGYQISSLSSGADILNPTRTVGFYDVVESGLTLRFQSRGKDVVATLTDDDIGAYDGTSGNNASPPPRIQIVRALDSDLPRRIRLHYNSTIRDYQPGEQDSPFRPTSLAVNDQDVSIPIALGDSKALQCAEINWADAWNGRTTITVSIDQAWPQLEAGDCIALPINGFDERVRITKDKNSGGVLRQLTCVTDEARSYVSDAIAPPSSFRPPVLALISPTITYLMDLPALQDSDATAGFYVAMARDFSTGNQWRGGTLYESTDGGTSFSAVFSLTTATTAGVIAGAVPVSDYHTWDDSTVITVILPDDSLSFASITDDAVLAGGNAAAMGQDSRFEIVQFATATKTAPKTWNLSRLLRGRRGTEWTLGSSITGDLFVMLSEGSLNRVPLNTSEIGRTYNYKSVSIGASFGSGTPVPFTGKGVALKPFSPVDITATYSTDGDIFIDWVRRDKLGRTLMSGTDIPNTDPPLTFSIDISSHGDILRTLAATDVSVDYTAAQIATDFGSTPPAIADVGIAVYQISQIVGRGTPGYLDASASSDSGDDVPAPAAAVGFNTRTFGPAMVLDSNIRRYTLLNNTEPSGAATQTLDGAINLSGASGNSYNANLATAYKISTGTGIAGTQFGGGGYFEVEAKWDPKTGQPGTPGFPAPLWLMSGAHLAQKGADAWPGNSGKTIWPEVDIEFVGVDATHFKITAWTHYNDGTTTHNMSKSQTVSNGGSSFSNWNKFGFQWVPATDTDQGYIQWFFNRVAIGDPFLWDKFNPANGPPPVEGTTMMAEIDIFKQVIIFGTSSTDWPMQVRNFIAYQTDGSKNTVS